MILYRNFHANNNIIEEVLVAVNKNIVINKVIFKCIIILSFFLLKLSVHHVLRISLIARRGCAMPLDVNFFGA